MKWRRGRPEPEIVDAEWRDVGPARQPEKIPPPGLGPIRRIAATTIGFGLVSGGSYSIFFLLTEADRAPKLLLISAATCVFAGFFMMGVAIFNHTD